MGGTVPSASTVRHSEADDQNLTHGSRLHSRAHCGLNPRRRPTPTHRPHPPHSEARSEADASQKRVRPTSQVPDLPSVRGAGLTTVAALLRIS